MIETSSRPSSPARPGSTCPQCGATVEPGALSCLTCGRAVGMRWRRPSGWRAPVAVGIVLVALAGLAAGFGLSSLTVDPEQVVTVPSSEPPPPPPGELAPPGESREAAGAGLESWPTGERGYTVVLSTNPDENAARAEGERAAERGIDEVGVLNGRDYSELDPNLYVVFAGRYETSGDARRDADDYASQGYGDAYPRLIEPAD